MSKQVIVVRKDLNMDSGKLAAQVSHASMGAFFKTVLDTDDFRNYTESDITFKLDIPKGSYLHDWLTGSFVKIVLQVSSEDELNDLFEQALKLDLPVVDIVDEGRTFFKEPTFTCIGIGPCDSKLIDLVTGDLKLYR